MKESKITLLEPSADGTIPNQYLPESYPGMGFFIWPEGQMFFVEGSLVHYLGMLTAGWGGYFREPVEDTFAVVEQVDPGITNETLLKAIAVALKPDLAFGDKK